jgi:hypothetical protein
MAFPLAKQSESDASQANFAKRILRSYISVVATVQVVNPLLRRRLGLRFALHREPFAQERRWRVFLSETVSSALTASISARQRRAAASHTNSIAILRNRRFPAIEGRRPCPAAHQDEVD